jgi:hypothetical protein
MIYYNFILLEKLRAKDIGLSFLKEKDIGLKIKHEWDHCMTFKIKLSMLLSFLKEKDIGLKRKIS